MEVHIVQRSGSHVSYFGLSPVEAQAKLLFAYKRRLEAVMKDTNREIQGECYRRDGKWLYWYDAEAI
jgi:hypothetical protein